MKEYVVGMPGRQQAPLVIASNRGPVDFRMTPDGRLVSSRGEGGLIAVLGPVLADRDGVWIASARTDGDRAMARRSAASGMPYRVELSEGSVAVRGVDVSPALYDSFYGRVGTETLWFLHHHLLEPASVPDMHGGFRADWQAYCDVNDMFAAACAEEAAPHAVVLLQDYHLAVTPALLRARRPDLRIAHFTMCPWADPEHFALLPDEVAGALVEGMLGADLLGFLAPRWADNFLRSCRRHGYDVDPATGVVRHRRGVTRVRVYGVGVDVPELRDRRARPSVRAEAARLDDLIGDRLLLARVERMEPAKNTVRGLEAFSAYLAAHPEQRGRVVHYVLAYTSRQGLDRYRRYAAEVSAAVGRVNARFGTADWVPVLLDMVNNADRGLAVLARADVLLINPLRDGMNLVAKEGAAVNDRDAALILSREAGAAEEMGEAALLVDPRDVGQLSAAIASAVSMPREQRRRRLRELRTAAGALPPRQWLAAVLADLREPGAVAGVVDPTSGPVSSRVEGVG